jgi:hypothetical protein
MRIIFSTQAQGTAIRNLSLVHFKHRAGEMCGVKHKHKLIQSDYCRLECDTVVPEHTPPQYSDLTVEAARPSVTYLDTPRHIPEHNDIPGRRHNILTFRSTVYLQYSVVLSTFSTV